MKVIEVISPNYGSTVFARYYDEQGNMHFFKSGCSYEDAGNILAKRMGFKEGEYRIEKDFEVNR